MTMGASHSWELEAHGEGREGSSALPLWGPGLTLPSPSSGSSSKEGLLVMEPGEKGGHQQPSLGQRHTPSASMPPPGDRTGRVRPFCLQAGNPASHQLVSCPKPWPGGRQPSLEAGQCAGAACVGSQGRGWGAGCLRSLRPQAASQPLEDLGADSTPGQCREFTSTPRITSSQGAGTSWPHLQEIGSPPSPGPSSSTPRRSPCARVRAPNTMV